MEAIETDGYEEVTEKPEAVGQTKVAYTVGKKSSETGEVYAPAATIKKLKSTKAGRAKLARANKAKRKATRAGRQHAKHGLHKGKKR